MNVCRAAVQGGVGAPAAVGKHVARFPAQRFGYSVSIARSRAGTALALSRVTVQPPKPPPVMRAP